ncbi:magnesium transporter [Amorphus orientalis]|uniref:Magnesium transporter n=1 Tax=Amorphus orientalis TaxID=649198 RepID=A0AAE3VTE6_9HYPH|nr:magnesium transporter [Amorphus orientalis]MDQ0317806.1 magnesium transporter [Amorphus orientalis]
MAPENGSAGNDVVDGVAAILSDRFVQVPEAATCAEAMATFASDGGSGAACEGLVMDASGGVVGLVSLRRLLSVDGTTPVSAVATPAPIVARLSDTAEGVARVMLRTGAVVVPVLEADGRLAGVVFADRANRYLLGELIEDADRFVGIAGEVEDDYLNQTVWRDFRRRVPWVLGLAVAGLAAGYVVHVYEHALDALVILALYMPMVADTGGNVGTQSASLVTRAIAVGSVRIGDFGRILWRESCVSILLAATLFAFAFLKVALISNAADVPAGLTIEGIAVAIALALAVQVVTATLIGALLPLGALAIRQDPALVSGPALTTIVDLTGLILYFSITTWMLGIPFAHT